jgi:hypothetical protein
MLTNITKVITMAQSERLTFICPTWLKESLKTEAEENGLNMSEFIKDILKANVSRKIPTNKKPHTEQSVQG